MSDLVAVVITGVGTLLMRASFVIALARRQLSEATVVALGLIGPAVLGALVLSLFVDPGGGLAGGLPEALALVAGGLVAFWRRNLVLMVVVGMAVFWLVRAAF
jgi:branched-subunit amino acid transport protein